MLTARFFRERLDALAAEARSIGLNDHAEVLEYLGHADDIGMLDYLLSHVESCFGPESGLKRYPPKVVPRSRVVTWTNEMSRAIDGMRSLVDSCLSE